MPYGSMDTQDIVAWGEVKPDWSFKERKRITSLCDWGKKFGIDGFVRLVFIFSVLFEVLSMISTTGWKWICKWTCIISVARN